MNLSELLTASQTRIATNLSNQIDKLVELMEFKRDLRLWYAGKCEWLAGNTTKIEACFKKANLSIATLIISMRDNSENVIDKSFDMPTGITLEIRANMIGGRRPIKKSYNNSKQLETSAGLLHDRLLSDMLAAEIEVKSININQYSLEANDDGSAGQVMVSLSF